MWLRLCDALGKSEWKERAEWLVQTGRRKARKEINGTINAITGTKTTAEWLKILEAADIPCGPVYTMDQVFADPQVQHLGMASPVTHPRLGHLDLVASPLTFSDVPKVIRSPTPDPGQHTEELMNELGYTPQEIEQLRNSNVLR